MKISPLAVAILAILPASAAASVMSLGSEFSESCYRAADVRDASRQAMENCNKALSEEAITPDDRVATHVNRGILYIVRRKASEANADFDAALALDPNQPEAWLNKAVVQARFGKPADAMPLVQKALDLKTRRPALAYFVRALALEDSGNIAGAYDDLKRAQQLEPRWKEPQIELRRFQVRGRS